MKPRIPSDFRSSLGIILLCIFPLVASGPAWGALFSLEAEQAALLLGEPLYLRIGSFTDAPPSLEEGTVTLSIRGPDGEEREYRPPLRFRSQAAPRPGPGGSTAGPSTAAPPSRRYRMARVIASDGDLVFRKPGRFRLRLITPSRPASGSPAEILSDSLILTLKAPALKQDVRAYGIILRDPGEYGLAVYLEGGQQLRSGMAIIGELAGFPNAYRRTARFVLASDWAQDFTDFRGGASRPLNLEKSLALAEWSLSGGAYVPLRTAYRLRKAVDVLAVREPTAPVLAETRRNLAQFEASLGPSDLALLRSF
jgi:hypothetical protein